jgi:hypothetical protein
MTTGLFGPQGSGAVPAPLTSITQKRFVGQTYVKDATAPNANNGTVLDAAFFNRIIGALDYLCTASGITATVGDVSALARAVASLVASSMAAVLPNYVSVAIAQTFTPAQKVQAAANLGLAAVAQSGRYSDLLYAPAFANVGAGYGLTVTGDLHTTLNYAVNATVLDARYAGLASVLTGPGIANGLATLDGSGQLTSAQIPPALLGAVRYQSGWNAATNTPALSAAATKGFYWIVTTAGATNLSGITTWAVGDWVVSDGTTWERVQNADAVLSVAGLIGNITAGSLKTALAISYTDVSGLGGAATKNVGATTGTVAAGDDSRIVGAIQAGGALGTPASGNLLNCTFPTLNQSTSGNAATATKLATARTIAGASFDGSANISIAYGGLTGLPTLGTAAALNVGVTANLIVQLTAAGKLPAVDGSLLTGLASAPVSSVVGLTGAITAGSLKTALAIANTDVSGLGTAAALNVGTGASQVVQLTAASKLPAVDGSLLTNLPATGAPIPSSSSLPVGFTGLMYMGGGGLLDGQTTSGANIAAVNFNGGTLAHGSVQSGTWKNIAGASITTSDNGLFVRTA